MTKSTIKALQEYYIEHHSDFTKLAKMDDNNKNTEIDSILSKLGVKASESEITEIIGSLPSILEETELPDHLIQSVSGGGKQKDIFNDLRGSGQNTVTIGGNSTNTNINAKDGKIDIAGTQTNTTINRK